MDGKLSNKKLREEVFELCNRIGFWNVYPVAMAKKLNTAHANVSRWKSQYIDKYGIPNIEKMGKELNVHSQVALKELMKIMKATNDDNTRIKAIRIYFQSQDSFTTFLERFSYKEKVPDKIQIQVDSLTPEERDKEIKRLLRKK